MPRHRDTTIALSGLRVTDTADRSLTDLGDLTGVHLVVLMRHRH